LSIRCKIAERMDLVLSTSKLRALLFVLLAIVASAGVAVEVASAYGALSSRSGLLPLFSLSYEGNVPTFFTAILLSIDSLLLCACAAAAKRSGGRFFAHWLILALGFFYIAVDEVFSIHEMASTFFQGSGILYFSWVVPAFVLLIILGLFFLPFLRGLPRKTALMFFVSGLLYVGGAVGMELPLGWWTEKHGTHNLGYGLIDAVEETLEMFGLELFLLAVIDHLASLGVRIAFSSEVKAA